MAGIYQHHIPQSLIRSFRIPVGSKKKSKVWVYEKSASARLALVKNDVGGEPFFYSELAVAGTKTLDDKITDYETLFDRRLKRLKAAAPGTRVDAEDASEVVAHLTIRNAHLRQFFSLGLEAVYSRSVDLFGNEIHLRHIFGADDKTLPEKIRERVDEHISQDPTLALSRVPAKVFYQITHMVLQERFNRIFKDQMPQFIAMLSAASSLAPQMARDAHNKALVTMDEVDARTKVLRSLDWSIKTGDAVHFILPDCVALGCATKSGLQSLLGTDLKEAEAVLMPLSPSKMLVGSRTGAPFPNLNDFNNAAAAASNSFFVADLEADAFKTLQKSIGTTTSQFMKETMDAVLDEFIRSERSSGNAEAAAGQERTNDASGTKASATVPLAKYSYAIHFLGCADQETAERIAATVDVITRQLVSFMPLDRLDGITFAHDYPAALRELDRGFGSAVSLESTNEDYGVGIAMAPLVKRDGVTKTHIVMRGDLGHCLITENESEVRFALHVLIKQFAHAACMQMLDEALPGVLLNPLPDTYAAFLYPCIANAWESYFTSRASASFRPEADEEYAELLVSIIRRAHEDILAAKARYRLDDNMDRLMSVVCPRISDILRFAANVLGHRDGLAQPIAREGDLAEAVEKIALADWFTLFDSDLSELWSHSGTWKSMEEFLYLNRHVERMFWQFRLIPWKMDDGRIWVEVLPD
jgi:hypothetical protein